MPPHLSHLPAPPGLVSPLVSLPQLAVAGAPTTEPHVTVVGLPRAALGQATSFCGCVLAVACPSTTARCQCHHRPPEPSWRHRCLPQPSWPRMLIVTSLWAAPGQATLLLWDARNLLPPSLATGAPPLPTAKLARHHFPSPPNSLLCCCGEEDRPPPSVLSLWMIGGPIWAVGPTCQFK
jgi:hypothetical protein